MQFCEVENKGYPKNFREYTSIFQQALKQEIEELKKDVGGRGLKYYKGNLLFSSSKQFVYRFLNDSIPNIPDDTPIDTFIDNRHLNGQIVSTDIEGINISLEENMGDIIPEITIKTSRSKLPELLLDKFNKINSGEVAVNKESCMKLFSSEKSEKIDNSISSLNLHKYKYQPNSEQAKAILQSLTKEVTFIWGPPGTGKTWSLSIILDQLVNSNKKVLLTSHTNLAIDEILLKYTESLSDDEIIEDGKIIRYGTPTKKNPKFDKLILENIVQKKAEEKNKQIQLIEKKIKSLETDLTKYQNQNIIDILVELEIVKNNRLQTENEISKLQRSIHELNDANDRIEDTINKKKQYLKKIENANAIKKFFSKNKTEKIISEIEQSNKNITTNNDEKNNLKENLWILKRNRDFEIGTIKNMKRNLEVVASSLDMPDPNKLSLEKIDEEIKKHRNIEIQEYKKEINNISNSISKIEDDVKDNALVIGCTLTKAYLDPKIFNDKFDVMVLDEASMATLPTLFFASTLVNKTHYILTGDFRQLPPIVNSEGSSAKMWIGRNIFRHVGIEDSVDSGKKDERLVMLKEQYRMHPNIVHLINEPMYKGELETNHEAIIRIKKITTKAPFKNHPLVLVDTSTMNPWCKIPKMGSRVNPYNAFLSTILAKMALKNGIKSVGIITPYRAQAELIQTFLDDEEIPRKKIMASTIHKFQGNERECIIFDIVDGPPHKRGKLLKGPFGDSNAGNLINVAISRTQGKFIFVGNSQYIQNNFKENDAISFTLNTIQRHGKIIDSRDILPSYFDKDSDEQRDSKNNNKLISEENTVFLNENNFYRIFKMDLEKAQDYVIIFSPFITHNRMGKLMDTFRLLVDKGVSVYLITRKPKYQSSSNQDCENLLEDIQDIGISVIVASNELEVYEKFHEKIAFIDDEVFYHGSLNILSQNDSSESMIRIHSANVVKEYKKYFNIKKIIQKYEHPFPNSKIGGKQSPISNPTSLIKDIEKKVLDQMHFEECSGCQSQLILKYEKDDLVLVCPNCSTKKCIKRKIIPRSIIGKAVGSMNMSCEKCNKGKMRYKVGKYGPFLSCNQYPQCRSTVDLK